MIEADHHWIVEQGSAPLPSAVPGYERLANPHAARGMATSLKVAARAAQDHGVDALLILLADMPFVSAVHLRGLLGQAAEHSTQPVFSIAPDGVAQPPALFPASFFEALASLEGDKGARALSHGAALVECSEDQFFDVDSVEDLAKAAVIAASL